MSTNLANVLTGLTFFGGTQTWIRGKASISGSFRLLLSAINLPFGDCFNRTHWDDFGHGGYGIGFRTLITTCWVDRGICPSLGAFLMSPNMFINHFVRMQRIVLFQNVCFAVLASQFFSLCIILRWCEYRGFIKDVAQCVHQVNFFSKKTCWKQPTQKIAHLFRSQLRPFTKLYHVVSIHLAGMNFAAHSEASFWPFQSHGFHEFHPVWSSAKVHARRDDVVCVKVRVRRYEAVHVKAHVRSYDVAYARHVSAVHVGERTCKACERSVCYNVRKKHLQEKANQDVFAPLWHM